MCTHMSVRKHRHTRTMCACIFTPARTRYADWGTAGLGTRARVSMLMVLAPIPNSSTSTSAQAKAIPARESCTATRMLQDHEHKDDEHKMQACFSCAGQECPCPCHTRVTTISTKTTAAEQESTLETKQQLQLATGKEEDQMRWVWAEGPS